MPQRLAWFEFGRNLLIESHNSLSEQGELRGARAALNHLLAYNSNSPKICVLVAQFALRIGDHQQAFDLACSALALDRNCHSAETIVFKIYKKYKQTDEARARLAKLEQEGQYSPGQLAQLAEASGHIDQAERLWVRQLDIEPSNPEHVARYLSFLLRSGRIGAAYQILAQADPRLRRNRRLKAIRVKIDELVDLCGLHEDVRTQPDSIELHPALIEAIFRVRPKPSEAIRPKTGGSKIAVVIDTLGPGGAERQCAITCQALSKHRVALGIAEVQLFCGNLPAKKGRPSIYLS